MAIPAIIPPMLPSIIPIIVGTHEPAPKAVQVRP